MAGTVGADALRADNMDTNTNCANIGGGAGTGNEPDIYYQGGGAVSRKVTAAGFYTDTGATRDMTATGRATWLAKVSVANYSGATLLQVHCGSSNSDYVGWTILASAGQYPAAGGGFLLLPLDPAIIGYRDSFLSTGSPVFSAADYFAVYMEGPTSKAENLVMDAVDLVYGLYLTAGTGGSPGTFSDFLSYDEGTIGNRYGFMSSKEGILYALGQFVIGATTSAGTRTAAACVFNSADDTIIFPDGRFAAGWSGLTFDLGNAGTDVDLSGGAYSGRGDTTTTDTRPILEVFGTAGTFDAVDTTFGNFASFLLTSACVFDGCSIGISDLTLASAEIKNSTLLPNTASGVALCDDASFGGASGIHDCEIVQDGSGHAFEITSGTSISLTNINFTGFGGTQGSNGTPASGANDAAIYNNTGGALTINVSGGSTPSIRNGAGATTTVNNSVTVTLTGLKSGSEIRVWTRDGNGDNDQVVDGIESSGTSWSFSGSAGQLVNITIYHLNYLPKYIEPYEIPSNNASIPTDQSSDRIYLNP